MRGRLLAAALAALTASAATASEAQEWTSIGPTGGNVGQIAVDESGQVFVAAEQLLFRWDENSGTWTSIRNAPGRRLSVSGRALYRTGSQITYRSDDGGTSWHELGKLPEYLFDPIAADPAQPATLFAAAQDANSIRYVFKSTDSGATWHQVSAGLPSGDYSYHYSVLIDAGRPQTVFLGSGLYGVFRSVDGGESWTAANDGFPCPGHTQGGFKLNCLSSLALAPDGTLYAGAAYDGGLYRSDDGAASWHLVAPELAALEVDHLAVDPSGNGTILAIAITPPPSQEDGTRIPPQPRVFRSDDGGASFTLANEGLPDARLNALAIDPTRAGVFYAATERGAYRSVDAGGTWQAINDALNTSCIEGFGFNETTGTLHAIGAERYWRGLDHGASWEEGDVSVTYPGYPPVHLGQSERSDIAFDPHDGGAVYAYDLFLGPFASFDDGESWSPRFVHDQEYLTNDLAVDAGRVFVATDYAAVLRSDDHGLQWQRVLDSGGGAPGQVEGVAADPSNDHVFALYQHALMRSRDGGNRWQRVGDGVGDGQTDISRLLLAPTDPPTLLAVSGFSGLRISRDLGHSWHAPDLPVSNRDRAFAAAVAPHHPQTIYTEAATQVFRSDDAGVHWRAVGDALPRASTYDLAVDPDDPNVVYAGLCGAGVQMLRQQPATSPSADTAGCDIVPPAGRATFWPLGSLMILALLALVHRLRSPDGVTASRRSRSTRRRGVTEKDE